MLTRIVRVHVMPPSLLIAFFRVHWGVSSRSPWGSVGQQSYFLPPPTTIVGAVALALAKLGKLGAGEFYEDKDYLGSSALLAVKLLGIRWASSAWVDPVIRVGIPIHYFAAPYRSHYDTADTILNKRRPVHDLYSIYDIGYVVGSGARLAVALLVSRSEEAMKALAYVGRLGSKESFIDPLYVAIYRYQVVEQEYVSTQWLTPVECTVEVGGRSHVFEKMPLPSTLDEWRCWYSIRPCKGLAKLNLLREVIEPKPELSLKLKPATDCAILEPQEPVQELMLSSELEDVGDVVYGLGPLLVPKRVIV